MLPIYKFTDFDVTDVGMVMKVHPNHLSSYRNGFEVAYFDGSYKERFLYKRDLTNPSNAVIGMVFHSSNGNRINLEVF